MSGFRELEQSREQLVLWPTRLDDAVPANHPVRLLDLLLGSEPFAQTFRAWEREYDGLTGRPPYHPRDLAGLYLYGMLNRLRSSRQLEAACYNRLDVIWLLSGQNPDHATIAAFVTRHAQPLRQLFRDALAVGLRAGLIKLEHTATDGTKIEADAGRGSVRSEAKIRSWLAHLEERVLELEQEWNRNESREVCLLGDQAPWAPQDRGSLDQQLAQMKRQQAQLQQALQELERRREESSGSKAVVACASTSDPSSRSMRDKEGRTKPNYNAQLTVDTAVGMIVAQAVNDAPEDSGQLTPMLEQVESNCGCKPAAASADSQYNTGPELEKLEQMGISGYLPDNGANSEQAPGKAAAAEKEGSDSAASQDAGGRIDKSAFVYERESDSYRCPAGHSLRVLRTSRDSKKGGVVVRRQYGFVARGGAPPPCANCVHAAGCCDNPARGRTINRDQFEEHRERMRERMNSAEGRAIYKRRKETVEPRFGQIKRGLGVRRFLRRGIEKVRTEWSLVCTAINLSILMRHWKEVLPAL